MTEHHDSLAAWFKMAATWLVIGVGAMTPLQVIQALAAVAATVYSVVQTFILVRDRILKRRGRK